MREMKHVLLFLAMACYTSADAQFDGQEAEQKGFADLTRSGKLIQLKMQSEPKQMTFTFSGNDLGTAKIVEGGVEASFELGGVTKTVRLSRVGSKSSSKYRLRTQDIPTEKFRLKVKTSKGEDVFDINKP